NFLIFILQTAVGQITRRDYAIGCGIETGDNCDSISQHRIGVDPAIGQDTGRPNMEIRDLRDDHWSPWINLHYATIACRPLRQLAPPRIPTFLGRLVGCSSLYFIKSAVSLSSRL